MKKDTSSKTKRGAARRTVVGDAGATVHGDSAGDDDEGSGPYILDLCDDVVHAQESREGLGCLGTARAMAGDDAVRAQERRARAHDLLRRKLRVEALGGGCEQRRVRDYCMGLDSYEITPEALKSCVRDAVLRVHRLLTDRLCGRSVPKSSEESAADQRLIDGEFDLCALPGQSIVLSGRPQVFFRPTRLVMDDEAAEWYDVEDVKVGQNSQLVSAGRLPGSAFKSSNLQTLSMDAAQVAMVVSVRVVNVSNKPRRYPRLMVYGNTLGQPL